MLRSLRLLLLSALFAVGAVAPILLRHSLPLFKLVTLAIARASAGLLLLLCLLLIGTSRLIVGSHYISKVLSLESCQRGQHHLVGLIFMFLTMVHICAHVLCFTHRVLTESDGRSVWHRWFSLVLLSWPSFTGWLMTAIIVTTTVLMRRRYQKSSDAPIAAHEVVKSHQHHNRRNTNSAFQHFYSVHLITALPFMLLICVHGLSFHYSPIAFAPIILCIPTLLTLYRIGPFFRLLLLQSTACATIREATISGNVLLLKLVRTEEFPPGSSLLLHCSQLSRIGVHPFCVARCDEETITLVIYREGPWTQALFRLIASTPRSAWSNTIDLRICAGPILSPMSDCLQSMHSFHRAVLICAGSTITSLSSACVQCSRYLEQSDFHPLQSITIIWLVREHQFHNLMSCPWLLSDLTACMSKVRCRLIVFCIPSIQQTSRRASEQELSEQLKRRSDWQINSATSILHYKPSMSDIKRLVDQDITAMVNEQSPSVLIGLCGRSNNIRALRRVLGSIRAVVIEDCF